MRKPFEKAKEVSEDKLMRLTVGAIHESEGYSYEDRLVLNHPYRVNQ